MAAEEEVDERGWIVDYENPYDMDHKVVEAMAEGDQRSLREVREN